MNLFFSSSPLHNPLAQPEVYTAPLTAMKSTTGPAATQHSPHVNTVTMEEVCTRHLHATPMAHE